MINSGKTVKLLLSVLSMVVASSVANATVYGNDPRKQVPQDYSKYTKPVGVVTKAGTSEVVGTAFLVGECVIQATFHSTFLDRRDPVSMRVKTVEPVLGHELDFHIGSRDVTSGRFEESERVKVIKINDYDSKDTYLQFKDQTFLASPSCLGKKYGYLKTKQAAQPARPEGKLMVIGYHQDRFDKPGITIEEGCQVQDQSSSLIGFTMDCSTMPMSSGSPVLEKQSDGEYLVVGTSLMGSDKHFEKYSPDNASWMGHSYAYLDLLNSVTIQEIPAHVLRARAPQSTSKATKLATAPRAVVR
ncbi:MAG: hypothetical protein IPJ84_15625 [Bdellovibrionales bacterium]|nr:hypothetical protein [Bdellovibrionales bacterium]